MKKYIIPILLIFSVGCSYKKENWIVKAQDGKFYKLVQGPGSESYRLELIDTAAILKLEK